MKPFALTLVLLAACGAKTTADYAALGPHGIGLHVYTFVDASRPTPPNGTYAGAATRTLPTNVWYPATGAAKIGAIADAPLDGGGYPVIVYSHGFLDNRDGEGYLGEHLASHGYVVVAPDYPLSNGNAPGGATVADVAQQPIDARFVVDQVLAESASGASLIHGAADPTRIAAAGLSLGGLTTLLVAFHPTLRDPRIAAALPIAPLACFFSPAFYAHARVPLQLIHGDLDRILSMPENSQRALTMAQDPRALAILSRGTHTGYATAASYFDPNMNFDNIGCAAVAGKVDAAAFAALGGEAEGIIADPSLCPLPCTGPDVTPVMGADRQHDLTTAIARAFFDAQLKHDDSAATFLANRLAVENTDVTLGAR